MADTIEIIQGTATTVEVAGPTGPQGPAGAAGATGAQGPQGVPGTGLEVLTTQGDLLYQGASTGQRLAIGTSGQVLKVANGIPAWGAESGAVTSVNGETGTVILDGSEIDTSANDNRSAFTMGAFGDGDGIYYPLPDTTLNSKQVYRNTTGHHVFFQSLRWHITDGSPNTQNIIESSDNDNAAWPWLSAWSGDVDKAKLADVVGRARNTFLFVGDSIPNTSVSGLGTAAIAASTDFAAASHSHGNLTNAGAIGTTANLPLKTGTNGVIEAGSFSNVAGSFCEGNDARLSDARTPTAHKASHSTGGTDALAPSDIGAQSLFVSSNEALSADITLSAARAQRVRLENYNGTTYNVTLPTTDVRVGDVFIFTTGTLVGSQIIRRENFGDNYTTLATISSGQSYRIISTGTTSGSWQIDPVFTHTHAASAITSGTFDNARINFAAPPAIGNTTPAAGSFTNLSASAELQLPTNAPASPTAGDLYRVTDTLRYRDSGNTERLLLNATDNLANLANTATARTNLGLGSSSAVTFGSLTANSGTLTASAPALDVRQTWNNAGVTFTAAEIRASVTARTDPSYLLRMYGGASGTTERFRISDTGMMTVALGVNSGDLAAPSCAMFQGNITVGSTGAFRFTDSANNAYGTPDVFLFRDAAGALAQRNGTNAQESRLYSTFTSSTNYQRMTIKSVRQTLSALSGASATTTGTFIPDGAVVVGVTTRVSTLLTGATGYTIGDGTDADRWGDITGTAVGTTSDNRDWTAATIECFTAGGNITLTAQGSNFTAGAIEISVFYLAGEAD